MYIKQSSWELIVAHLAKKITDDTLAQPIILHTVLTRALYWILMSQHGPLYPLNVLQDTFSSFPPAPMSSFRITWKYFIIR
jgi:hypothetical protein